VAGHINVIIWLYNHGYKVSAWSVAQGGHIEILDWMFERDYEMDQHMVDNAACAEPKTLQWCVDHKIYPLVETTRLATLSLNIASFEWLWTNGYHVDVADGNAACGRRGSVVVLDWLESKKHITKSSGSIISRLK
jgi:hypothetical protein